MEVCPCLVGREVAPVLSGDVRLLALSRAAS